MKLHLSTFKCEFDEASEMITVMHLDNLSEFLCEHNLETQDFKPDFVNEKLNEFIFCTDNNQWRKFINIMYEKSETKVCLHEIPTPEHFDFYEDFYSSNPAIINYILHPLQRDYNFLMESSCRYSNEIVFGKIYEALESPKTSGVTSLKKFKKFWLKVNCYGQWASFTTTRKRILSAIYRVFPVGYRKIYYKYFMNKKSISNSFRSDLISCSDYSVLPF